MDLDHEEKSAERKETDAQRRKRLIAAVSSVLASPDGRTVLKEILSFCQVEAINAHEGAASGRVEGARTVGIRTVSLLRSSDPAGFIKFYQESYLS